MFKFDHDQILMSGYLYYVRYWAICELELFFNQVATSWVLMLTLSFNSNLFFYKTKELRQNFKYL